MEKDLTSYSFIGKDIEKLSELYNSTLLESLFKPVIKSNNVKGIVIFTKKRGVCTYLLYISTGHIIEYFDPNLLFAK
jgi:hypothetical protein